MKPLLPLVLITLASCVNPAFAAVPAPGEPALTPDPDDLWVMAGDSITAQRQHTNYIEAFYRTRYPGLGLRFRNSGIGGNRTNHVLARFDHEVAAWKPTVVSVELGMNDVGGGDDPAGYVNGMRDLVRRVRDAGARPVLISSSPVNDGSLPGRWASDRCRRLDAYTDALKKLADEERVVFVDQYHPLLELWGGNFPRGAAAAVGTRPAASGAQPATGPAGTDARSKPSTGRIPLGGDAVHPGPVGQYTMAATILAALNVDREVSSAVLRTDGTVVGAVGCKITDAAAMDGRLSFTRSDERMPWPIDPKAKAAVELLPVIADLSRYTLAVRDLPAGRYDVTIEGRTAATLTEKELAAGWNMSTVFEGALAERSAKVVELVGRLQGKLNNDWRAASKAKDQAKRAAAQAAIDECEHELRTACQPAPLGFEVRPAK